MAQNFKNATFLTNYTASRQTTVVGCDLIGSFALATFVSETVGDSVAQQSPWAARQSPWVARQYLPWPPWVAQQEIETILSVSHRPRWPRQEQW